MAKEVKAGEVWKVTGRKGPLTIRVLTDVADPDVDGWFEAEILTGNVKFMSTENRLAQKYDGFGTPGDKMTFRTTLTNFVQRVSEAA